MWSGFAFPLLSLLYTAHAWLASTVPIRPQSELLRFELRHYHAVSNSSRIIFADAPPSLVNIGLDSYEIRAREVISYRPSSHVAFAQARTRSLRNGQSEHLTWDEVNVWGPDVESRDVLLHLAKMTNNAYLLPDEDGWYDLGDKWSPGYQFGWEPDQDGFRGHVFATPDNDTVVLSIKGTSVGMLGRGGPTSAKDKFNDNLLFSCCCAKVDWTWTPVCGCHQGGWRCGLGCLEEAMIEDSVFYPLATDLYNNLTYMYPYSNIWVIGHSLGGALAAMIGTTFGPPVVAFQSPGEKRAAARLHLPLPPSTNHITHVIHTADPIAMGTCNGIFSSCALAGYAMETKCHLGKTILYDTVGNLSWSVDVRTHGIVTVIEKLLSVPWAPSIEIGREVPEARVEEDCVDCYSWEFG